MPKHIVISQSNNTLYAVVDIEVSYQQSLVDDQANLSVFSRVSSNSSKQSIEETKHDRIADNDWRSHISISQEYDEYREVFLEMLEPFQSMGDGHLWTITAVTYRIGLT